MPYFNLWDSLVKEISYLGSICKEPFTLEFQNQKKVFSPPKEIKISENFFRGETCLNCGKCCQGFWSLWIEDEVDKLEELYPGTEELLQGYPFKINEKEYWLWTTKHTISECIFRKDNKCLVHNYNPIHCRIPHIKFKQKGDITYITKEQFGRNYRFGCPVKFREYTQEDKEWDLEIFHRLINLRAILGIRTHYFSF